MVDKDCYFNFIVYKINENQKPPLLMYYQSLQSFTIELVPDRGRCIEPVHGAGAKSRCIEQCRTGIICIPFKLNGN